MPVGPYQEESAGQIEDSLRVGVYPETRFFAQDHGGRRLREIGQKRPLPTGYCWRKRQHSMATSQYGQGVKPVGPALIVMFHIVSFNLKLGSER